MPDASVYGPRRRFLRSEGARADRPRDGDRRLAGVDQARCEKLCREAVAAIRNAGGHVHYDSGWTENTTGRPRMPSAPDWLLDSLGFDYFAHVDGVAFAKRGSDEDLVHVGRLPRITYLTLIDTNVTDAGLANLREMKSLVEVSIPDTRISDAGLANLTGSTKLLGKQDTHRSSSVPC